MAILRPRPTEQAQDRFLQCEEALEAEFQALVWKAMKAGWDEAKALQRPLPNDGLILLPVETAQPSLL